MTKPYVRLDRNNAAVLLVDHQSGLLSLVHENEPDKLTNNVLAIADLARYVQRPTTLTTSFEKGPNGPLMPELKTLLLDTPYIARPGNINARDNDDFVQAVKATGKKHFIIHRRRLRRLRGDGWLGQVRRGFAAFGVGAHGHRGRAVDELVSRRMRVAPRLAQ